MTRLICNPCTNGIHPHDTYTGERAGEDAGCPKAVDGHECRCQFRKPRQPTEGAALAEWIEQTLGLRLEPWQKAFLARWRRVN